MTREELATMTDQELLAYEREHHDDPDILLPDRTREIADGNGSDRRGEPLSP